MANLPVGAYRSGSLDAQIIYDENDLPIGFTRHGNDSYFPRFSEDQKSQITPDGATWCLVWKGTQAEYDAIPVKSATVLYVIL